MEQNLPDIVRDSKLEVKIFADHIVQIDYVSNPITGQRRSRVEQRWQLMEELGKGSYGAVWLAKCTSGPASGQIRAVKELSKGGAKLSPVDYCRELEAITKFSQERVRHAKYIN